ncbi:MAG: DNA recombination protein RmuC [Amphiplicatus sp.]
MTLGVADLGADEAGVFALLSARQDAPAASGVGQTQALTESPAAHGPLISGPASLLWTGVGAVLAVFFLVFFVLIRTRLTRAASTDGRGAPPVGRPSRSKEKKAPKTDFFEPAGEDAEITFDDEPPKQSGASRPAPPAAHPKAHQGDLSAAAEEEAEIVIERPARAEPAAKPGAFAGLFARKEPSQSTPYSEPGAASLVKMKTHPLASERRRSGEEPQNDNDAESRREQEAERQRAFAEIEERRLAQRRLAEEEARRLEEEETARREQAFAAAEQRRLAAEQESAREAEARARDEARRREAEEAAAAERARFEAERAAEFETRKKAAALEQRERELARWAEELAGDNDALKRQVGEEVDRRFAALSSSLEERSAPSDAGVAAALTALSRDLDQRLGEINERLETRLVGLAQTLDEGAAPNGGARENVSAMAEMVSRRIADHRESINATIAALSNRIDTFAGAAEEVSALRKDISALKRAMGERAYGPGAATVQLADLVKNSLPPDAFELRASLANNRKADCLIRLPYPPGPIAVDARFPVEAFQALYAADGADKTRAENEFRRAALRHVVDIAERLIVPEETAESALMFLPSESMYATLHERFPDIVQDSYRARVWIVSPTTLMATLHTVRAVMRDAQARESAELIHTEAQHVFAEVDALRRRVIKLEEDFGRAHHDVRDVLSSTDQVFRRAESISKSHRTLADDILGRGSRRILSAAPKESDDAGDTPNEESDPDTDDPPPADRQPFPLR